MVPSHLLTLIVSLSLTVFTARASSTPCRCLSTDDCWPSRDVFATLQAGLSKPLITPTPLAAPCYSTLPLSGSCSEVQEMWPNATWRTSQPGQMVSPNWEAYLLSNGTLEDCPLNATLRTTCEQGNVPILGVDARTPEDIQTAVAFAVAHNLRVVVKNTG